MTKLRRSIIASVLACILCLPGVASAGGWLVLTLDELPAAGQLNAGQEVVLGFVARQHGREPIGRAGPVARFTHQASGQQVSATAIDEGPNGHYVVRFTPPTAGAWDWSIRAWEMDHPMPALTVAPAPSAASVAALAPARVQWPLLAASGALALVAGACLVVAWRGRTERVPSSEFRVPSGM
jgi:hypothetical protein